MKVDAKRRGISVAELKKRLKSDGDGEDLALPPKDIIVSHDTCRGNQDSQDFPNPYVVTTDRTLCTQAGAVTTVEECVGQAAQEAEGENSLSTVEELLARVDMSRYEVAQEEDEKNPITTADHLAAVMLQEGVAQEEIDREHLARAIKRPRGNMSPDAGAREEEGQRESEGVHSTLEEVTVA